MINIKHEKEEILSQLKKQTIGILATIDNKLGDVRQRVMYYGIDNKFTSYLMSTKESPKINQILTSVNVSFIVFGLENPYDDSWELEIGGKVELLNKKEDVNIALENLRGRNPFADVALESGISGQFDLLKLKPLIIRYRLYGESLKGVLPTILEF